MKVMQAAIDSIKINTSLDVLNRSSRDLKVRPFNFLRNADPSKVANLIQDESPKTIALILTNLEIDFAACVLEKIAPDFQVDVVKEIAILGIISPEDIKKVEKHLIDKLSNLSELQYSITEGGISAVVEILNRVSRNTERDIVDALEKDNPEIANEIRKIFFVFEDIVLLNDRSLQVVIREVDKKDLSLAMKATPQEICDRIYKNMSKRAADTLREEIQSMGPVKIRDVEMAQQKVVNFIRILAKNGKIVLSSGQGDKMIV